MGDMSSSPPNPRAAYCEEYSEDKHTTLPETRQTANIAVKRSRTDIAKLKTADTRVGRSDSGNSSQTVATINSGDSSLESKAGTKQLRVDTAVHTIRRRPKLVTKQSETQPSSPQKSSYRRSSSRARDERPKKSEQCDCAKCRVNKRTSLPPLETSLPAAIDRHARPRNEATITPQSAKPSLPRAIPNAPVYQPVQARPRALTSQSYRQPRPMSYHGSMPETMYIPQQPPVLIERQQPALYPSPLTFPQPSYPPLRGEYFPVPQPVVPRRQDSFPLPPSPYEIQPRPRPNQWAPEYQPRRQSMIYNSPPILEYPQPQYIPRPPSAQPAPRPAFVYYDLPPTPRENYVPRDEDFYRMPPPPAPAPLPRQSTRPPMRHSATTSTAHPMLHHPHKRNTEEHTEQKSGRRSPKKEQGEHHTSRRPSLASRPSATPSSGQSSSHSIERGMAHMSVESGDIAAKQKRRTSYYSHERPRDLERVVETYQADVNTTADALPVPITSDSLKLVRKKTHSDTGSRASAEGRGSREGSDVKPRSSTDRRGGSDVKARKDKDGVTVRFHHSSGVNLDVKGGEGRTISLRPSRDGDGEMEFSIGNKERHGLSRTASRTGGRERHQKTYPSVGGTASSGVRELEVARSVSRVKGDRDASRMRGERDTGRDKERRVAASHSRRSSRSGFSGRGTGEGSGGWI